MTLVYFVKLFYDLSGKTFLLSFLLRSSVKHSAVVNDMKHLQGSNYPYYQYLRQLLLLSYMTAVIPTTIIMYDSNYPYYYHHVWQQLSLLLSSYMIVAIPSTGSLSSIPTEQFQLYSLVFTLPFHFGQLFQGLTPGFWKKMTLVLLLPGKILLSWDFKNISTMSFTFLKSNFPKISVICHIIWQ